MAVETVLNRRRVAPAEDSAGFGPVAERFRRAGELDRAVALCQEGLQKYPNHLSSRVTLGWALLDLGRYDEARVELELVLKRAPDNLAAIRGLAQLHDRTEHDDVASMQSESSHWAPPEVAEPAIQEVEEEPVPDFGFQQAAFAATPIEGPSSIELEEDSSLDALASSLLRTPASSAMSGTSALPVVPIIAAESHAPAVSAAPAALEAFVPEVIAEEPAPQLRPMTFGEIEPAPVTYARQQPDPAPRYEVPKITPPPRQAPEPVAAAAAENEAWWTPPAGYKQTPVEPVAGIPPIAERVDPLIDGPGPWPPVFAEDVPAPKIAAPINLARTKRDAQWPPAEPPAPQPVLLRAALPKKAKEGLLGALGRLGRKVEARKQEDSLSEYKAG